eukprot:jgi/Mesvir1/5212/Mv15342-RA.1
MGRIAILISLWSAFLVAGASARMLSDIDTAAGGSVGVSVELGVDLAAAHEDGLDYAMHGQPVRKYHRALLWSLGFGKKKGEDAPPAKAAVKGVGGAKQAVASGKKPLVAGKAAPTKAYLPLKGAPPARGGYAKAAPTRYSLSAPGKGVPSKGVPAKGAPVKGGTFSKAAPAKPGPSKTGKGAAASPAAASSTSGKFMAASKGLMNKILPGNKDGGPPKGPAPKGQPATPLKKGGLGAAPASPVRKMAPLLLERYDGTVDSTQAVTIARDRRPNCKSPANVDDEVGGGDIKVQLTLEKAAKSVHQVISRHKAKDFSVLELVSERWAMSPLAKLFPTASWITVGSKRVLASATGACPPPSGGNVLNLQGFLDHNTVYHLAQSPHIFEYMVALDFATAHRLLGFMFIPKNALMSPKTEEARKLGRFLSLAKVTFLWLPHLDDSEVRQLIENAATAMKASVTISMTPDKVVVVRFGSYSRLVEHHYRDLRPDAKVSQCPRFPKYRLDVPAPDVMDKEFPGLAECTCAGSGGHGSGGGKPSVEKTCGTRHVAKLQKSSLVSAVVLADLGLFEVDKVALSHMFNELPVHNDCPPWNLCFKAGHLVWCDEALMPHPTTGHVRRMRLYHKFPCASINPREPSCCHGMFTWLVWGCTLLPGYKFYTVDVKHPIDPLVFKTCQDDAAEEIKRIEGGDEWKKRNVIDTFTPAGAIRISSGNHYVLGKKLDAKDDVKPPDEDEIPGGAFSPFHREGQVFDAATDSQVPLEGEKEAGSKGSKNGRDEEDGERPAKRRNRFDEEDDTDIREFKEAEQFWEDRDREEEEREWQEQEESDEDGEPRRKRAHIEPLVWRGEDDDSSSEDGGDGGRGSSDGGWTEWEKTQ